MAGRRLPQVNARKQLFLNSFRLNGNVSQAARDAEIDRSTPYGWRDDDKAFAAEWAVAEQESIDRLEQAARERAEKGIEDYVVSQGKLVYIEDPETGEKTPLVKRVYSDTLMVLLLKAHRPEKFKERSAHEVTGKDGGPVEVDHVFELDLGDGEEQAPES